MAASARRSCIRRPGRRCIRRYRYPRPRWSPGGAGGRRRCPGTSRSRAIAHSTSCGRPLGRLDRGRLPADVAHLVVGQARGPRELGRQRREHGAAAVRLVALPPSSVPPSLAASTDQTSLAPTRRSRIRPLARVDRPVVGRHLPRHHRLAEAPVGLHDQAVAVAGDRVEGERHARPTARPPARARRPRGRWRAAGSTRRTGGGTPARAPSTRWPSTCRCGAAPRRSRRRPGRSRTARRSWPRARPRPPPTTGPRPAARRRARSAAPAARARPRSRRPAAAGSGWPSMMPPGLRRQPGEPLVAAVILPAANPARHDPARPRRPPRSTRAR